MQAFKIFAINPGSTSTKIAMFEGDKEIFKVTVNHEAAELDKYPELKDQLPYRRDTILKIVAERGQTLEGCDAFVGRGGGLQSCEGGTYNVNDVMLDHARNGTVGRHPATLGSQLADEFARTYGGRAFIVNPPDVDELEDVARVTGLADVYRESRVHALNQKETAIRCAAEMGGKYTDFNFVVGHIGGGVSISAHKKGRIVDNTDIINGEGPMTPTRAGALPAVQFMDLCFSGKYDRKAMYNRLTKTGGFVDHLGTSDMLEVAQMIRDGNQYAKVVYDSFIYQLSKYIGAMAAALHGKVDAIVLTGGIVNDKNLVAELTDSCGWIAPVKAYPGEFEMEALSNGALRVLRGEESAKTYTGVPVWCGFKK